MRSTIYGRIVRKSPSLVSIFNLYAVRPLLPEIELFLQISTFSKTGPIVGKLCWFKYSWPTHIILLFYSLPLSRISRSLSHNSRPLSRKSMKHRKYTIRAAQNIQNFKNRPNNHKVMSITVHLKKRQFFSSRISDFRDMVRSDNDIYIYIYSSVFF